jgi:hypothetical protein
MTLRQLLRAVNLDAVYAIIHKKDCNVESKQDTPTLKQTIDAYTPVIHELMLKPKARKYSMSILVRMYKDLFDKHFYPDVCFLNPKYVAPPEGHKPWGGNKNMPSKHYNCNLNKHNEIFAMGFTPWSKIIDTPVVNRGGFSNEQLLAEILWELTFYGWTEKKVDTKIKEIKGNINEAMKQVKEGKCVKLPAKKKGGLKVVIPDCVSQQIMDIVNKPVKKSTSTEKCGTCFGWGLWALGNASPMGPMDGSDGMPTRACPECGANPNPSSGTAAK